MTDEDVRALVAAFYIIGGMVGMMFRAADWFQKQTEETSYGAWWRARRGPNMKALGLLLLLTAAAYDGALFRWTKLEGSAALYVLAPLLGGAVTYLSHYFFAASKRRAETLAGGPVDEGE